MLFYVMIVAGFTNYRITLTFNDSGEYRFEIIMIAVGIIAQLVDLCYRIKQPRDLTLVPHVRKKSNVKSYDKH
jgi:hypothetical protein